MAAAAKKRALSNYEVDVIFEEEIVVERALLDAVKKDATYGAKRGNTAATFDISDSDAAAIGQEANDRQSAEKYVMLTADEVDAVLKNPPLRINPALRKKIEATETRGNKSKLRYAMLTDNLTAIRDAAKNKMESHTMTQFEVDVVFDGETKVDANLEGLVKGNEKYGQSTGTKLPYMFEPAEYVAIKAAATDRSAADNYTTLTRDELAAIASERPVIDAKIVARIAKYDARAKADSTVLYWYSNADKALIADAVVAAAAGGGGGGKAPAPPKPKVVAAPAIKPGAPAKLSMNYEAALQPFLTEPPILAQVINAGMQRVRQTNPDVQTAVGFLEGMLGRRLTFTMADVAPLAAAVRQRIGLKANAAAAAAVPALVHVSVYASLLGQANMLRLQVSALVALMRAWAKCLAEPRSGPQSVIARQLVTIANDEFAALTGYAAAGDSKDLYILLAGSPGFKEDGRNLFAAHTDLACNKEITMPTDADGLGDLQLVNKQMVALDTSLEASYDKANDYVDPRKARRVGKGYALLKTDKTTAATAFEDVAAAFRAHGRLYIKIA